MDGISFVEPGELRLDPENPRLPEEVIGESQSAILRYLFDNAVLDELATSYTNNGFFEHEPLMVARDDHHYVVLEGNRRLAALKILLQDEEQWRLVCRRGRARRPSPRSGSGKEQHGPEARADA